MKKELAAINFRQMKPDDYEEIVKLWQETGLKVELDELDSLASIKKSLKATPQLHIIAEDRERIVGAIIGTYDYRKGYLHRMAVSSDYRRRGIATELMLRAEREFIKLGVTRIDGLIFKGNSVSKELVKKIGWEPVHDVLYVTKSIK